MRIKVLLWLAVAVSLLFWTAVTAYGAPGDAASAQTDGLLTADINTGQSIAITYTNSSENWRPVRWFRRLVGWIPEMVGMEAADHCGATNVTFTNRGTQPVMLSANWTLLNNKTHGFLQGAQPHLLPVATDGTCSAAMEPGKEPIDAITLAPGESRAFAVVVQPSPSPAGSPNLRPGAYEGRLEVKGMPPVTVTLTVRESMGVALLFMILGLVASWIVAQARLAPRTLGLEHRLAPLKKLGEQQPAPVLFQYLLHWTRAELGLFLTQPRLDRAERYIETAELIGGVDANGKWAAQLNYLNKEHYLLLRDIQNAILQLKSGATITDLHDAIKAAMRDRNHAQELKAPGAVPESRGAQTQFTLDRDGSSLLKQLVGETLRAIFGGASQVRLMMLIGCIFLVAFAATLWAAATAYLKLPSFGADPKVDFGMLFGIGYVGKEFNNVIQRLAPSMATYLPASFKPVESAPSEGDNPGGGD